MKYCEANRVSHIIILLSSLVTILSGTATAQPYGFLTWTVADGLPQSQVTALAEDARGYLWVGTNGGGVARFDGAEFEPYGTAEGLPDNFIRALLHTADDQLYALTKRGLSRMGTSATDTTSGAFLPQHLDGGDDLFQAATVLSGEVLEMRATADNALRINRDGREYLLQRTGPDRWTVEDRGATPLLATGTTLQLTNGNRLQGTRNRGLFLLSKSGEPLAHYTEAAGDLPHDNVLCLLRDRQNRYWIGTSGGGLVRMIPTGLRYFDADDGLAGNRVYALHAAPDGRLWIGAGQQGIQFRADDRFQRPAIDNDPTRGHKITHITKDGGGRLYFATDGAGVTVLDSSGVRNLDRQSGLASNYVLRLLPLDDTSVVAVSYDRGLSRIRYSPGRDSLFVNDLFITRPAVDESYASAISGPDSSLLLGTNKGQVQWQSLRDSSELRVFGSDAGLPPGRVTALALRRNTQLWVAVLGYGLYYTDLRMPQPRFFPLPGRMKVSSNIFQITADPSRPALWLGTERGLTRLFVNTEGQPDYLRHYGRAEGFLGGETTRGATTTDSLGRVWFGTLDGLVRYEEEAGDTYLAPPPTTLERIRLFYEPVSDDNYDLNGGIPTFAAADNHFQFRYTAVDLTYPRQLRYRFRLRGETSDWSPLTDERAVRYAGLDPGRYTFEVAATTDGGKTFGEPAAYTFIIRAPLVRSGWFLGLVALLFAGLIVGVSYGFYRRVQRREAALRAELVTQKRLLELEQKARQLQMNPHFIFNALNGIRGVVDGRNDAEARRQITHFASLMRGILNNSRQDVITLAEETDVLRRYIEMERFCQNFPIEYSIQLPENADPEEISLPPMLLQPFVENAILHGLAGKENGGRIDIDFLLRGRRMQCTVTDNGIGRQAAGQRQAERTTPHKSVAVDVTRERLQSAGGSLDITDRPGGGTVVTVIVPVDTW